MGYNDLSDDFLVDNLVPELFLLSIADDEADLLLLGQVLPFVPDVLDIVLRNRILFILNHFVEIFYFHTLLVLIHFV